MNKYICRHSNSDINFNTLHIKPNEPNISFQLFWCVRSPWCECECEWFICGHHPLTLLPVIRINFITKMYAYRSLLTYLCCLLSFPSFYPIFSSSVCACLLHRLGKQISFCTFRLIGFRCCFCFYFVCLSASKLNHL